MFELKTEGFVIKRYTSLEPDETAIIFTKEYGKIFIKAKGTKKITSKLKTTLEVFSLNNYYLIKRNNNLKFFKLIQAKPVKIYENIRTSMNKIFLGYLIVQLINKFVEPEDANRELYDITKNIFELLNEKSNISLDFLELFFKIKLLKYTGFNIINNLKYYENLNISKKIQDFILKIDKTINLYSQDIDFELMDNANIVINNYIKSILGQDLNCFRLIDNMK